MSEEKLDKTSELLADVSVQDLMAEVQRRLDCAKKPEKRLILIGPPGEPARRARRCSLRRPAVTPTDLLHLLPLLYQAAARALKPRS